LVVLAAVAFFAGVLVAVRFAGFVAAVLAFVAATSPFRFESFDGRGGMHQRKTSAMSNVAFDIC
jgi:hypothetical protein